jgi:hypothetical protein
MESERKAGGYPSEKPDSAEHGRERALIIVTRV